MECEFCLNHEQGDTLYESSDWDGGIGFDYIRNIKYCPLCGRKLNAESADRKTENSSEKPNNCDKDEPQTVDLGNGFSITANDCDTCKYDISEDDYDLYDMCEPMVEGECRYEPKDEPQTDCSWK